MILDLRIENFAIIDHLELSFTQGLIVFTGETGAGKSIIIDAVETILGGRTDLTMIRAGAEMANVEASFSIPEPLRPQVSAILEKEELLDDPQWITLGRQIRSNGRSAARVNGRSVSAALLKEIGQFLVDVHGQSEHLSLLRVNEHLGLLDSFSDLHQAQESYQVLYKKLLALRRELAELRLAESEAERRIDMLNYQINEIESARLLPDEEEGLRAERNRLANAEGLASLAQEALQILDEGDPSSPAVTDLIGQAGRALSGLARLDPSQSVMDEQAQNLGEILTDLVHSLRDYLENIEFNPKRLDQVEERLNLISTLKRKYGKPGIASIQDVLAFAKEAHRQLDSITHASERIIELEEEQTRLLEGLGKIGEELSRQRHRSAEALESALETELNDLNMNGARFKVEFVRRHDPNGVLCADGQRVAFDANGLEHVEFLVAPNPGEGLKPLVKIASGGETSRLMLAIKNVLARADQVPTLIFDEIDQGIGGRVGTVVGRKLRGLARQHQVLCVTHLPQLAAFGEQHLHVRKNIQDGRTSTHVESLSGENRMLELAQMMGEITEGTRRSAAELLESVKGIKP
jgi:DNA repair protein RecN (Recombination protein N)